MDSQRSEERNGETPARPDVWLVAYPFFSHVLCFLHFAKRLASHGLTVTFFATEEDSDRIYTSYRYILESWKREALDIRIRILKMQPLKVGSSGMGGTLSSMDRLRVAVIQAEDAFEKILRTEMESQSKPTCLISDMWLPGTREVATEFDIPAWILSPFSSVYTATNIYFGELRSKGILNLPSSPQDEALRGQVIGLPGLFLVPVRYLPGGLFSAHPLSDFSLRNAHSLQKAPVVLCSGFKELEGRAFTALEQLLKASALRHHREMPHVWSVGPTFPFLADSGVAHVDEKKHPSLEFLDTQPPKSVLFVAFGTEVNHSREQMEEIAFGLENSDQPFLCVLHPPRVTPDFATDDIFTVIPPDLVERTKGRGLFVQRWAPQQKILSHPSTGGFISHCGHNSMLESLCMGVPLLSWPIFAEQGLNCRFLVDEAKAALEVCRGSDDFVDRKEVERSVRALFHSEEGEAIREKALEYSELAKQTVGENGSTTKNIQALVALIKGL